MKRIHKKILGLCGLALVVSVTIFAAFLPTPETQAMSSVTETVIVRVVGEKPNVYIVDPSDGEDFLNPEQTINYNYENVDEVEFTLEYIDSEGHVTSYPIGTKPAGEDYGSDSLTINFKNYGGGKYGQYVIKAVGTGPVGTYENAVSVYYWPVSATAEEDEDTGDADVNLNYQTDNEDIKQLEINVYYPNGELIGVLSGVKVTPPDKTLTIPFSETNLPEGKYIITVTALGADGQPLCDPYPVDFIYSPVAVPDTNVPDTGGLFATTNISQTDYLITGLLVFGIVGTCGIIFIAKDRRKR